MFGRRRSYEIIESNRIELEIEVLGVCCFDWFLSVHVDRKRERGEKIINLRK
jgi:hypothetical protein